MLPDRVSNPGPLTYESGALPIALRGPAVETVLMMGHKICFYGEMWLIIPKLSLLLLLIWSTADLQTTGSYKLSVFLTAFKRYCGRGCITICFK